MIEFEVKSKTQPIGKRKGQTVYFAQPVSQHHLTNKMVVDRIVRETSLSAGDVSNALISLGAIVRDAFELGQSVDLADLGSFRIIVPPKMMDSEAEVTADSLKVPKIVFTPKAAMRNAAKSVELRVVKKKKDGKEDEKATEQKFKWDEENSLLAADENGFVSNYLYDADGERTVKTSGEGELIYVNSEFAGGRTNTAKFSLYVSPYLVANQGGRYTKHIYIGSQRVVSKIGDFDSYGSDPRRIQYAGSETDGLSVDYKVKYTQQLQAIKDNYATFAVPYNGEDNNDYVDGKGFCCNDGSLEAAQVRVMARAMKNNFQEGDSYEKMQFYYHPDHLGSSSYFTNLEGEVVQRIEYVPFGEVFVEERNNIWNTPYLFNAKEFDEETGLYYYGARYYDPRLSLWLSIDPKEEKYSNVSTYCYVISNPLKYTDPTGMEIDMTKVRLADEQLKLSTTQSVIKDLASQTGLQLSLDKDNKLQYAKNDEGKPIVNKITNKKGKEIDAGSKTARNFLIKMIDNKTEIEVSYHAKRTVTSGTQIGLSFEQISNMVKSAVGVDGNTLGFGMTFLHELHHTTIGGDYHDSTELFGTGPVVDNMNIIRNELNKQGFNYGERLNYKAIHTKEGNIIPFNESALTSLKYNSSMGKKAHYIKTK